MPHTLVHVQNGHAHPVLANTTGWAIFYSLSLISIFWLFNQSSSGANPPMSRMQPLVYVKAEKCNPDKTIGQLTTISNTSSDNNIASQACTAIETSHHSRDTCWYYMGSDMHFNTAGTAIFAILMEAFD